MTKPIKKSLPSADVRDFRRLLEAALSDVDSTGRSRGSAVWGVYAFYDYEGEPIYVGQTKERLSYRIRRHLTNQRSDAVAMRILDVFEVAEVELWPLWLLDGRSTSDPDAKKLLDAYEYSAYRQAINASKYRAILNEKIPPVSPEINLPPSKRFSLITDRIREERDHPDVRIARRAETLSRLAAVAHERGEVSAGLRRVIVIQAVRVAHLAATRLAYVEGWPEPPADAIQLNQLIGSVLAELDDGEA